MTTSELIKCLREVDPSGTSEVDIYIHTPGRNDIHQGRTMSRPVKIVRKFLSAGNVKIGNEDNGK